MKAVHTPDICFAWPQDVGKNVVHKNGIFVHLFGRALNSVNDWFSYSLVVLVRALLRTDDEKMKRPTSEEMQNLPSLLKTIVEKGYALNSVLATSDDKWLPCVIFQKLHFPNAYYEDKLRRRGNPNLLLYHYRSALSLAAIEYPDSLDDSRLSSASELIHVMLDQPHPWRLLLDEMTKRL